MRGATAVSTYLLNNYPNPFNPITNIEFHIEKTGFINLDIYNVSGQLVKTLISNEIRASGKHVIQWNGLDNIGNAVGSGVYSCMLKVDELNQATRILLLR